MLGVKATILSIMGCISVAALGDIRGTPLGPPVLRSEGSLVLWSSSLEQQCGLRLVWEH
jgi:hypothetical protein